MKINSNMYTKKLERFSEVEKRSMVVRRKNGETRDVRTRQRDENAASFSHGSRVGLNFRLLRCDPHSRVFVVGEQ